LKIVDDSRQQICNDKDGLLEAQLASTLLNIRLTLIANVAIALSAMLIVDIPSDKAGIDPGAGAAYWFVGVVALALLRYGFSSMISRQRVLAGRPRQALKALTGLGFVSGLSWCPVPLYFAGLSNSEVHAYIIFVMCGLATGAVIQSLAYWRISAAFGAPLMAATTFSLVLFGATGGLVVAADVLLLSVMLFRAAFIGERNFARSHRTAFEATTLAASLGKANQELERIAKTDVLTGLGNRGRFNEAMEKVMGGGEPAALVLFDLDRFKTMNDTHGHSVGDKVLQVVAERLHLACGPQDLAVRLGGDEFGVVVWGSESARRAVALAESFLGAMRCPIATGSGRITAEASIGIAAMDRAISSEDLYKQADAALYRAKEEGRGRISIFGAPTSRSFSA